MTGKVDVNINRLDSKAYTLRLTQGPTAGVWRVTLYCAQTGQRLRFATLDQLFEFLRHATGEPLSAPDTPQALSDEPQNSEMESD